MHKLPILFLKEWRQLWREQRLPALYALLLAGCLLVMGTTMAGNAVESHQSAHAADLEYSRWLNQGEKYAHAAAHYGMYVFRPVYGLANLDPGVQGFVGHSVWLEAHVQDSLIYRPAEDSTFSERLGSFTPAFLLLTVLPLFVILLGYGSVAAERERGTLRLVLACTGNTYRLMASKLLALFTAAMLPLLLVFGVSIGFAASSHLAQPPGNTMRWVGLFAVYAASLAFWVCVTLGVSAWVRTGGQALAALLTAWCLFSLVLPRATAELAEMLRPAATQQQLAASMSAALGDVEGGDREAVVKARLLAQYHVQSVEQLPLNWEGVLRNEGEAAGDRIFDRFWGSLFETYREQQTVVARLAFCSPTLAASWLSQRLASTDIQAHVAFVEAAEAHRRLIERILNDQIQLKLADPSVQRPNSGREVWSRVPPFHYTGAAPDSSRARSRGDIASVVLGLSLQLGCAGLLVLWGARRLRTVPL